MEFGYGMGYTTPTGSSGPFGGIPPSPVDISEREPV
jgi:hypothetical protein